MVSACMSGTRGSGVMSNTGDVLEMSVVRGVGGVCDMCMCLARGGVGGEGGEWMRELGLGFTNPSQLHCIPLNLQSYIPGSIGHFRIGSIVCVCSPQSHMVSASLYFHFSMFDLQRPIPVRLFRHFQCNHGASDPLHRCSDGMDLKCKVCIMYASYVDLHL